MLSSPAPLLSATTDLSFFSAPRNPSKAASNASPPTVVVNTVTRVVRRAAVPQTLAYAPSNGPPPPTQPLQPKLGPPPSSSPQSSPSPAVSKPMPPKKRKTPPEPKSSDSAQQAKRTKTAAAPKEKKPRKAKAPKSKPSSSKASSSRGKSTSSRGSSRAPEVTAPQVYRSDSRRSLCSSEPATVEPVAPRNWRTDEDGEPGPDLISSEEVVKRLMKSYKAYFKNPNDENDRSFEPHPKDYPYVELQYPNGKASERFILLAPKDVDHYNPIYDLEASLYTIIDFYCTDAQKALFGPIPTDTLSENLDSDSDSDSEDDIPLASVSKTQPPKSNTPQCCASDDSKPPLLRAFKRALNTEDGPAFKKVVEEINALLLSFKNSPWGNPLMRAPLKWTETGLPQKLLMRIVEENYQRCVGPNVPELRRYQAFTSTVYGELMPSFIDEIVRSTRLREDSLFLDLGSGVGNVCVQASLQTGCRSFGVELMPTPAKVAVDVKRQMEIRTRMWGLRMGEVELEQGDMLKSAKLDALMPKADVVLVDNKVFTVDLNEALRPKFLDLKEGAIVVSLAPFVKSENERLTDRNLDDISTIFTVHKKQYRPGSVSWGHGDGHYWVQTVDRTSYAEVRRAFEEGYAKTRRSGRRGRG